ncbi:MAG: hypothetical protein EPN91_02145 [Salinibacterium sp.]|nr:MAG: hypothetical protein EPN91_02145 [Salinibacterium sp.]
MNEESIRRYRHILRSSLLRWKTPAIDLPPDPAIDLAIYEMLSLARQEWAEEVERRQAWPAAPPEPQASSHGSVRSLRLEVPCIDQFGCERQRQTHGHFVELVIFDDLALAAIKKYVEYKSPQAARSEETSLYLSASELEALERLMPRQQPLARRIWWYLVGRHFSRFNAWIDRENRLDGQGQD